MKAKILRKRGVGRGEGLLRDNKGYGGRDAIEGDGGVGARGRQGKVGNEAQSEN